MNLANRILANRSVIASFGYTRFVESSSAHYPPIALVIRRRSFAWSLPFDKLRVVAPELLGENLDLVWVTVHRESVISKLISPKVAGILVHSPGTWPDSLCCISTNSNEFLCFDGGVLEIRVWSDTSGVSEQCRKFSVSFQLLWPPQAWGSTTSSTNLICGLIFCLSSSSFPPIKRHLHSKLDHKKHFHFQKLFMRALIFRFWSSKAWWRSPFTDDASAHKEMKKFLLWNALRTLAYQADSELKFP